MIRNTNKQSLGIEFCYFTWDRILLCMWLSWSRLKMYKKSIFEQVDTKINVSVQLKI